MLGKPLSLLYKLVLIAGITWSSAYSSGSMRANISAKALKQADGKVVVQGVTNLPEGIELMIVAENQATYSSYSSKIKASKGRFVSEPLGPMEPGGYRIEVIMIYPSLQPVSAQKIIGAKGEKLRGPLTFESNSYRLVKYQFQYTEGNDAEANASDKSHKRTRENVQKGVRRLIHEGRSMGQYRGSESLNDAKICGQLMRKYQSEAKDLQRTAEQLPNDYDLGSAASEVQSCVSCLESWAESACDRAEEALESSARRK